MGIFIKHKPASILLVLRNYPEGLSLTEIEKKVNVTYVYINILAKKMKELGLITSKKVGKSRIIILTEKGKKLAQLLAEAVDLGA